MLFVRKFVAVGFVFFFAISAQAETLFEGVTKGSFAVSPTGAATYTIPIEVPPGIAGLQPELALTYNSQGGNGLLGMGWSLSGLSAITRCPKTYAQDGEIVGIKLDTTDRYCLNGQRLVAVNGKPYGEDGTEYRTEIDSFTKITSYGTGENNDGPGYFIVQTKTGRIIEFGNTPDSNVNVTLQSSGQLRTLLWAANKISDTVENELTISYIEEADIGHFRVSRIDYGNGNLSARFEYPRDLDILSLRPDSITGYLAGAKYSTPTLLSNIQTYSEENLIRDYRLSYEMGGSTTRNQITKIEECDLNANCKNSRIVEWLDGASEFESGISLGFDANRDYRNLLVADVNGDGKSDLIYQAGTNGGSCGAGRAGMYLSNGSGFDPIQCLGFDANRDYRNLLVADVDGDGKSDLIYQAGSNGGNCGAGRVGMYLSNGNGFDPIQCLGFDANRDYRNLLVSDVNGDGKSDLIYQAGANGGSCGAGRVGMYLSNGTGFNPIQCLGFDANRDYRNLLMADVDGDGKSDLIYQAGANGGSCGAGRVGMYLSNGTGFSPIQCLGFDANRDYRNLLVTDVNGDGKSDLIYQAGTSGGNFGAGQAGLYSASNQFSDLVNVIRDEMGNSYSVSFKPLTENNVYTKYDAFQYPIRDIQNSVYVTESVTIPNGVGGQKTKTYHYEGAKVHLLGRGFLGFAKQTVTTVVDGAITNIASTNFRQDFPYVGRMSNTEVHLADGALVGQSDYTYDYLGTIVDERGVGPIYPYQTSNTKEKYEIDGSLVSSTTTTTTLESTLYGDVVDRDTIQIDVKDAFGVITHSTTSTNDFAPPNQYCNWCLGRITKLKITANNYVDAPVERETNFDYFDVSGLLKTEIREPSALVNDADSVYLKTEYTYDSYGHKNKVTVSDAASAKNPIVTRFTTTTYDYTTPAFPRVTVTNHLDETEERIYDARWGKVISVAGADDKAYNRATTFGYNTFGRKNQESYIDGTQTTWERFWCDSASLITCEIGEVYYQREESTGEAPSTVFYDMLGREIRRVTKGFNNITIGKDTVYDARMRVERVSRNYLLGNATRYWAVRSYDDLNRVKTITAPDNSVTTTTYAGLTTSITRQRIGTNGFVELTSSQTKNPLGQVVKATDAQFNDTTYRYTPFGNPKVTTDSANNPITMVYDVRGRKKSMDDPDLGNWQYKYDAVGNLRKQTDAKLQSFVMVYDTLNRLVIRTDQSLGETSHWAYYNITDALANRSVGQIKSVSRSADGYNETYRYDTLGRAKSITTTLDGLPYVVDTDYYPNSSRVRNITYPQSGGLGRAKVRNIYDSLGNLAKVVDGNDASAEPFAYWSAIIVNADGDVTWEALGNGLSTLRGFEPSTGRLKTISTGVSNDIQDLEYGFDSLGNLEYRTDNNQMLVSTGVTEAFYYDDLNRLETVTRNGGVYQTISYDSLGNIRSKTGVGTYAYDGSNGAGPHAVSSIGGAALTYDANGNMVTGRGRTVDYTTFNKPDFINQVGASIRFTYSPENARYKKVTTTPDGTSTQYNIGKLFERLAKTNGVVEYKNYIFVGGAMVAIDTRRSNGTQETDYIHTDHIGSTDVITNSSGVVKERHSYDPFGKYRTASWDDGAIAQLVSNTTPRGFTGHEMLAEVGLIHMNGRVYDPDLGRFVSADPFIQFPYYSQSLNRYSYVLNNPLSYIDPTGFRTVFDRAGDGLRGAVNNVGGFIRENSTKIIAAAKMYVGVQLMSMGAGMCAGSSGAGCPTGSAVFFAGLYLAGDGLCDVDVTCAIRDEAAENGVQYSTDFGGSSASYDSEDSPEGDPRGRHSLSLPDSPDNSTVGIKYTDTDTDTDTEVNNYCTEVGVCLNVEGLEQAIDISLMVAPLGVIIKGGSYAWAAIGATKGAKVKPQDLKFETKRQALRQAKRDAGIPTSQTHKTHIKGVRTDRLGGKGDDLVFENGKTIQHHKTGHNFKDNPKPQHFNNHPGTKNHYIYDR